MDRGDVPNREAFLNGGDLRRAGTCSHDIGDLQLGLAQADKHVHVLADLDSRSRSGHL